jgi:aconitate hydratase 2/2-methylisocitrate dehydratase
LSDVAGAKIDEVFIGSCMTNIGHFRAASKLLEGKRDIPVKLWMAPPTKMDAQQLTEEGHYGVFGNAGARMEMPGCSLVHGQPGAGERGRDRDVDQHPQLPQPSGQKHPGVFGLSRVVGRWHRSWAAFPRKAEYLADMGVINADGRQDLQVFEL